MRFAKAVGAGEMVTIHAVRAAHEKAIGRETGNRTIHHLPARHGSHADAVSGSSQTHHHGSERF